MIKNVWRGIMKEKKDEDITNKLRKLVRQKKTTTVVYKAGSTKRLKNSNSTSAEAYYASSIDT